MRRGRLLYELEYFRSIGQSSKVFGPDDDLDDLELELDLIRARRNTNTHVEWYSAITTGTAFTLETLNSTFDGPFNLTGFAKHVAELVLGKLRPDIYDIAFRHSRTSKVSPYVAIAVAVLGGMLEVHQRNQATERARAEEEAVRSDRDRERQAREAAREAVRSRPDLTRFEKMMRDGSTDGLGTTAAAAAAAAYRSMPAPRPETGRGKVRIPPRSATLGGLVERMGRGDAQPGDQK